MVPSAIVGSFSEETRRRGARDRRGLRGEAHRRGQGHRAKRCGYTHILSSETPIAKEHVGTGVEETGGKRLADAMIKARLGFDHGAGYPGMGATFSMRPLQNSVSFPRRQHLPLP